VRLPSSNPPLEPDMWRLRLEILRQAACPWPAGCSDRVSPSQRSRNAPNRAPESRG